MSESAGIDRAMPVLPIDYAPADEASRLLRPVGWLALAHAGVLLVDMVGQLIASAFAMQGGTRLLSPLFVGILIFRGPILVWMAWSARSVARGNAAAADPLRRACQLFAGVMLAVALVSPVLAWLARGGIIAAATWAQILYGTLRTALEAGVPLTIATLLRSLTDRQ